MSEPARKAAPQSAIGRVSSFHFEPISSMPRFYFDLFLGSEILRDEEGHEVVSLRAAETEALRTVGELARDRLFRLPAAVSEDIRLNLRNEHRRAILTVTVSVQVNRADDRDSPE